MELFMTRHVLEIKSPAVEIFASKLEFGILAISENLRTRHSNPKID